MNFLKCETKGKYYKKSISKEKNNKLMAKKSEKKKMFKK